ncbi:hypothetical protein Tco_0610706 [Tanacetum coccineum]
MGCLSEEYCDALLTAMAHSTWSGIIGGGDEEGDGGERGEAVVSVGGGVGEIEVAVGDTEYSRNKSKKESQRKQIQVRSGKGKAKSSK